MAPSLLRLSSGIMKKYGSMLEKTRNQARMKAEREKEFASRYVFKEGHGTASNACYWKVCYDKQLGIYTAQVSFGGAGGGCTSLYQINGDIFNQVGTFEDDDYKSERHPCFRQGLETNLPMV